MSTKYDKELLHSILAESDEGEVGRIIFNKIDDAYKINELIYYVELADDYELKCTIEGVDFGINVIRSLLTISNAKNVVSNYKKIEKCIKNDIWSLEDEFDFLIETYGDKAEKLETYVKKIDINKIVNNE